MPAPGRSLGAARCGPASAEQLSPAQDRGRCNVQWSCFWSVHTDRLHALDQRPNYCTGRRQEWPQHFTKPP
ncbi:unnamed protein product, partial [Prorocentrum cordatum]